MSLYELWITCPQCEWREMPEHAEVCEWCTERNRLFTEWYRRILSEYGYEVGS